MRLEGKIAVITGTAAGIGRATALRFAEEGAAVVGADVSQDANAETARLVQDAGGKMISTTVDVTDNTSVAAMFELAQEQFGRVDIIFNNAGVMLPGDDDALSTSDEVIDRTLAINVKGVIHGCRHGIPMMRRSGGGSRRMRSAWAGPRPAVRKLSRETSTCVGGSMNLPSKPGSTA